MYRAVEATRDILPGEVERWQFVEDAARRIFRRYGFREIRTPVFEFTELFVRSVGVDTDIVSKEMYTFLDRGKRSLTLRPEGTAPTLRAYVEHQVHQSEETTRWFYCGPMFRYERKQKGRYRQFAQIGVEAIGSASPLVDAEVVEMVMHFLGQVGVTGTRLRLNSIGCDRCRPVFRQRLVEAVTPIIGEYCEDCRRRLRENPFRILDCKIDRDRVRSLPVLLDDLDEDCRAHFEAVQRLLRDAEVPFVIDPHLVRGLDYYMRTAFEVTVEGLGAQNALLGGGRYDGLMARLGGPDRPGFGLAIGLDRLIMVLPEHAGRPTGDDVMVVAVGAEAHGRAASLAQALRHAGLDVAFTIDEKSVKAQMRRADRIGARFALILGEKEIASGLLTLRRLGDGEERSYASGSVESLVEDVKRART